MVDVQAPMFGRYAEFKEYLEDGMVYGYKRDKHNRPVIIYNMRKGLDSKLDATSLIDTMDFLLAYTQYHALVPGKIESWNVIIDMKNVALWEFPIGALVTLAMRMKAQYKVRLYNVVAINVNWLLVQAGSFVKRYGDPRKPSKILIFMQDFEEHLFNLVGKEQLE